MAVAFVSAADNHLSGGSWIVTVGTVTNGLLVAGVAVGGGVTTSVSWNSLSFTKAGSLSEGTGATSREISVWYLIGPTAASTNISVVETGTAVYSGGSMLFSGVSQASPVGTLISDGGTARTTTSATTSSTVNDLVFATLGVRATSTVTIGGSQNSGWNFKNNTNIAGVGSYQTGGASITDTFAWTTADNGAAISLPILNDAGGGGTVTAAPTRMMNGMGA